MPISVRITPRFCMSAGETASSPASIARICLGVYFFVRATLSCSLYGLNTSAAAFLAVMRPISTAFILVCLAFRLSESTGELWNFRHCMRTAGNGAERRHLVDREALITDRCLLEFDGTPFNGPAISLRLI